MKEHVVRTCPAAYIRRGIGGGQVGLRAIPRIICTQSVSGAAGFGVLARSKGRKGVADGSIESDRQRERGWKQFPGWRCWCVRWRLAQHTRLSLSLFLSRAAEQGREGRSQNREEGKRSEKGARNERGTSHGVYGERRLEVG